MGQDGFDVRGQRRAGVGDKVGGGPPPNSTSPPPTASGSPFKAAELTVYPDPPPDADTAAAPVAEQR